MVFQILHLFSCDPNSCKEMKIIFPHILSHVLIYIDNWYKIQSLFRDSYLKYCSLSEPDKLFFQECTLEHSKTFRKLLFIKTILNLYCVFKDSHTICLRIFSNLAQPFLSCGVCSTAWLINQKTFLAFLRIVLRNSSEVLHKSECCSLVFINEPTACLTSGQTYHFFSMVWISSLFWNTLLSVYQSFHSLISLLAHKPYGLS